MQDEPREAVRSRAARLLVKYNQPSKFIYVMKDDEEPAVLGGELCLSDGKRYVQEQTMDVLFSGATFCMHLNLLENCKMVHVSVRPGFKVELLESALRVVVAVHQTKDITERLLTMLTADEKERTRKVAKTHVVETKLTCHECRRRIPLKQKAVILFTCGSNKVTPSIDDYVGCYHQGCYLAMMDDDETLPDHRVTLH